MSLQEAGISRNLPVDLKDQWRYKAMAYVIAGQTKLPAQMEPLVGRLFLRPYQETIFTFTGVGPIAINLEDCTVNDVNSPYRIPSPAEIVALGSQKRNWPLLAPDEDIPARLLNPTTENELPFQLPYVGKVDSRVYRELSDPYTRNMVVGLNLKLLGLTRQDIISGNFTQEAITKIYETRESIQRQSRVEPVLPTPHDEVLSFPHGKVHALVSPRRIINHNRGEGDIHLVEIAFVDTEDNMQITGAIEKEVRYRDMVKNPAITPSEQVAKFEEIRQAGVKTYQWFYRDSEDRRLYAPDLTEGGTRELIDLTRNRDKLPAWFLENRFEIARQYVQNAKKLDECEYLASSDAYFVLGPNTNGDSVEVIVGDLGQGLIKRVGSSIYTVYYLFVINRQLLSYEEWHALLSS